MGFQRQATTARGGHRWSLVVEKEVLGFGGVWRGGEGENRVFHAEERIYNT